MKNWLKFNVSMYQRVLTF